METVSNRQEYLPLSTGGSPVNDDSRNENFLQEIFIIILAIIGIFGNGLVLYVFFKVPQLRVTTNIFICNQSLIDFCASFLLVFTFVPPEPDLTHLNLRSHFFASVLCRMWFSQYLYWTIIKTSTVNLTFLTMDRYFAVVFPLSYRQTARPRLAVLFSVLAWVIGAALEIYFPIIHRVFEDGECSSRAFKSIRPLIGCVEVLTTLIIPLGLMVFVYASIIIKLRPTKKKLPTGIEETSCGITTMAVSGTSEGEQPNTAVSTISYSITKGSSEGDVGNLKKSKERIQIERKRPAPKTASDRLRRNLLVTMFTVCFTYIICWTPNQVLYFYHNVIDKVDWSLIHNQLSIMLAFSNVCTNPIIYTLQYRSFKNGLKQVFKRG